MVKLIDKIKNGNAQNRTRFFALYFACVVLLLVLQLAAGRRESFVYDVLGTNADSTYELTDGRYIDTAFRVRDTGLRGVLLNGYDADAMTFEDEMLIVDFWDEDTGRELQHTEVLLRDQYDGTNIYIPLEQEPEKSAHIRFRIQTKGLRRRGLSLGVSKTPGYASRMWKSGTFSSMYLCASLCYDSVEYNYLKPLIYFAVEILIGVLLLVYAGREKLPVFGKREKLRRTPGKVRWPGLLAGLAVIWAGMFVFFDFVYLKTVEVAVSKKDIDIVCHESAETRARAVLSEGDELSQLFLIDEDNLSALGLHILEDSRDGSVLTYQVYDGAGKKVADGGCIVSSAPEVSDQLTDEAEDEIAPVVRTDSPDGGEENVEIEAYAVLDFPEALPASANHYYTLKLQANNLNGGYIALATGLGPNYPYAKNGVPAAGNLCMVSLHSSRMFLKPMFAALVTVLTVFLSLLYLSLSLSEVRAEQIFLPCVIVLGLVYSFLIPPYCVPDERAHIDTAYRISNRMLGVEEIPGADRAYKRACDIDPSKENTIDISAEVYVELWGELFARAEDETYQIAYTGNVVENATMLNYLPAALGFTAARLLHLSHLSMIMLGRWFNLCVVAFLLWLGIRKAPFGKDVLAVVGLLPMVLQQIASCSYDGLLLGAVYVFASYCLSLVYAKEKNLFDLLVMFVSGCFVAANKGGVYLPLLGMVLLIFWENRESVLRRLRWAVLAAFPFGLVFLAQFSNRILGLFLRTQGDVYREGETLYTLSYFIESPKEFVRIFQNTLVSRMDYFIQEMTGSRLGRLNVNVPWFLLVGFVFLIFLCLLRTEEDRDQIRIRTGYRVYLWFLCAASAGLIMLSMLLAWTQVGTDYIQGLQGRYFLPLLIILLLIGRCDAIQIRGGRKARPVLAAGILNALTIGYALLSVFYFNVV